MILARLSYLLIITIIAAAGVAVFMVLRPDDASHNPAIEIQEIINFSRFGVIESITESGQTVTVRFDEDFDTEGAFDTDSHVFEATVPRGQNIRTILQNNGVIVGEGGVPVTTE
jgi:hypothetical protein